MAEVSKSLVYEFEDKGLPQLRKGVSSLDDETEELGDTAAAAGEDLEDLGGKALDAADDVEVAAQIMESALEDVQDHLQGLSTMRSRRQMRRLGREIQNVRLKAAALDAQDIDIDTDVNTGGAVASSVAARTVTGGSGSSGGGDRFRDMLTQDQSWARNFSRLNDEVFALSSIFAKLGTKANLATVGLVALATASVGTVAAVGGLGAAATGLATQFGDADLRNDLNRFKQRLRSLAATFVDAFEPIIRNQILPAGRALAREFRGAIPQLQDFTRTYLPSLLEAIVGLVNSMIGLTQAMGTGFSIWDMLWETLEGLIEVIPALTEKLVQELSLGTIDSTWWRDAFQESMQSMATSSRDVFGTGEQTERFLFGTDARSPMEQLRAEFSSVFGEGAVPSLMSGEGGDASFTPTIRGEDLNKIRKEVGRLQAKFKELGTITREEFLTQLVSLREKGVDAMLKIRQESGKAPEALDTWVEKLKNAKKQLRGLKNPLQGLPGSRDLRSVTPAPQQLPGGISGATGVGDSLGAIRGNLGLVEGDLGGINELIRKIQSNFDTAANEDAQALVAKLQRMRQEMQETSMVSDAMQRTIARSADRMFQGVGKAVSQSVFGQQSGPTEAQARLQLFNAKDQMRSLRKQLRKGQISYRKFQLRIAVAQEKLQKKQEQLNDTMQSGWANALETMADIGKRVLRSLLTEVTAVIAKMAVLKGITAALDISSGGFLGGVISNLGGGSMLNGGAGNVPSAVGPGLAAQPTPGAAMSVNVQVNGQTQTDGRDIYTSYNTTAQVERRKGRA
jgi:hypothetical protein